MRRCFGTAALLFQRCFGTAEMLTILLTNIDPLSWLSICENRRKVAQVQVRGCALNLCVLFDTLNVAR